MPATFLLILLAVGLAALAPIIALAGCILYFFTRFKMLAAHALVLGLAGGAKLSLGWVLLQLLFRGDNTIDWSVLAICFGAGFSVGFALMLGWHLVVRPRPNNSFKPSPLRGLGAGAQD
jgi:hypothetical protein